MTRAKRKLNSSRGASILLALVLFLLCAMVSAVVVGSAMTNMQKVKNRQEQQQVYYSVSSAARLIHDAMSQVTFTGTESMQTYGCAGEVTSGTTGVTFVNNDQHPSAEYYPITFDMDDTSKDLPLAKILQDGAQKVYQSSITLDSSQRVPFTSWSTSFIIEDDTNPAVKVMVTIDRNYNLTFKLSPQDEKWEDDYQMTVLCAGNSVDPQKVEEKTSCTHKVKHYDYESGQEVTKDVTYDGILTTITTTINWVPGRILKGVSSNG